MKQKNYTLLYALLQAMVWGGFGVIISFAAPYLSEYGLTDTQYGLILGAVSAVSFLAQLGLAELCSRFSRLTLRLLLVILGVLMAVCCLALVLFPLPLLWIVLLYCLTAVSVQALPSFVNALGMAGLDNGFSVNFGVARGVGSAGFAVFSFCVGQLIELTDIRAVPALYLLIAGTLIAAALCFPKVQAAAQEKSGSGGSLWKNGRLLMILLGATLLYVSHNFLCNFLYQVAVSRGGDTTDQGICLAIAAFCELPVMFLFSKLLRVARCDLWLKLSGVFMGLRVLGCLLSPTVGWLYASQFFQLLGFALFSVSSVFYIRSAVDKRDTVRAQAMLASTCTLSNFLTFLLGGTLMDRFDVDFVLLCSAICAAVGTVLLILFAKNTRRTVGEDREV